MTDFKKDDRIVIVNGDLEGQHGKVINNLTSFTNLQTKSEFELDNGDIVTISDRHLNRESLIVSVDDEIKNLSTEIERVASGLPRNIGEELRTHWGYLKESLGTKDKLRFSQQFSYILSELTIRVQTKSVEEKSKRNIIASLKKLENWLVKQPH